MISVYLVPSGSGGGSGSGGRGRAGVGSSSQEVLISQCPGCASCVSALRWTDAASGGQICGTQRLQYIALILSSDIDAAQLRLVLPSIEVPAVSKDVQYSPAICFCSI